MAASFLCGSASASAAYIPQWQIRPRATISYHLKHYLLMDTCTVHPATLYYWVAPCSRVCKYHLPNMPSSGARGTQCVANHVWPALLRQCSTQRMNILPAALASIALSALEYAPLEGVVCPCGALQDESSVKSDLQQSTRKSAFWIPRQLHRLYCNALLRRSIETSPGLIAHPADVTSYHCSSPRDAKKDQGREQAGHSLLCHILEA